MSEEEKLRQEMETFGHITPRKIPYEPIDWDDPGVEIDWDDLDDPDTLYGIKETEILNEVDKTLLIEKCGVCSGLSVGALKKMCKKKGIKKYSTLKKPALIKKCCLK